MTTLKFSIEQTVAPTKEPVTLDDAKLHLRQDADDDNSYIKGLITAARLLVEEATDRSLLNATFVQRHDHFPSDADCLRLAKAPVSTLTSITYLDTDGNSQTFAASKYVADLKAVPHRVALDENESWPDTQPVLNAVSVTYVAGYHATDGQQVPKDLRQAVLMWLAHLYEHREPVLLNMTPRSVPIGLDALLMRYKVQPF